MRTNVELDDEKVAKVMAAHGLKTKRAAVDFGLDAALRESMYAERVRLLNELTGVDWDDGSEEAPPERRRA